MDRFHILILDDDRMCLTTLANILESQNFKVFCADSLQTALQVLKFHSIDYFFCDIQLGGLDALRKTKKQYPAMDVIMISSEREIDMVIEAFRLGAIDYINKPTTLDEILEAIRRTDKYASTGVSKVQATSNWSLIPEQLIRSTGREFIGRSQKIREVLRLALLVSSEHDINILITGENGTGKEVIARIIHFSSNRKSENFCPINCAAIPETLIESEFFGHKKGTFTGAIEDKKGCFEQADKGTLFLDEISEMPIGLQAKLLRAIEEKKIKPLGSNHEKHFDFRIISATNAQPQKLLKEKRLRQDLFHRLSTFVLNIPPLRERIEDISPLTCFFVNQITERRHQSKKWVHPEVFNYLKSYTFPGNVRELRNMVERAMLLADTQPLLPKHFTIPTQEKQELPDETTTLNMEENERKLIVNALLQCGLNKTKAAGTLGISRDTLIRKMRKFNIRNDELSPPTMQPGMN